MRQMPQMAPAGGFREKKKIKMLKTAFVTKQS